jgi:hypothetical protein
MRVGRARDRVERCLDSDGHSITGDSGEHLLTAANSAKHPASSGSAIVSGPGFGGIDGRARNIRCRSKGHRLVHHGMPSRILDLYDQRLCELSPGSAGLIVSINLADTSGTGVSRKGEITAAALNECGESANGGNTCETT